MISDYQLKHPLFGRKPSGAAALLLSSFCPFWLSTTSYLTYWISDVHTLLNTWFEPSGSSASPTLFFLSFYNAQNASSVYVCVGVRVRPPETTSRSRASLKCNMHLKFNELICTLCKPFSLPQPPSSPVCVLGARRRDGRHKRSIFFSVERSAWFEIGLSSVCVCAGSPTTTTHPNTASSTLTHTHTTINIFSHHPSSLLWMAFMQIYKDWPVWLSAAPNYYRIRFLSGLFFWHTTKIEFK